MKQRFLTSILLLLLVLTSCDNTPIINNSESTTDETTTSSVDDDSSDSSTSDTTTDTSSNDELLSEENYFHSNDVSYGTTNGNANNNGMAVYDHERGLHYFALGNTIYQFNPTTNTTDVLFSYHTSGHLQNLCLLDNDLYFVSTQTNFLYYYNLFNKIVYSVYEEETNKVYGYNNTIFANIKRLNYLGEMAFGLATYNHNKKQTTTRYNLGTTLVNINSSRLYYNENYGLNLNVMTDIFNGKTNIYRFSQTTFDEMIGI